MDFFLLDLDAVRTVLDLLPPHGWIACAQTCRELRVLCEEQACKPTLRMRCISALLALFRACMPMVTVS